MDEFTLFGCAATAGGAGILYLKLVSCAIEGVGHTLEQLDQVERAALRRRQTEREHANPTTATLAVPPRTQADNAQSLDDSATRNTIAP
ncbi:MAG: hypothetical protein ACE5E5_01725 [Phycisphaerae bacterium]